MANSKEARNQALVLQAFDALFDQRDYAAAVKALVVGQYPQQNHRQVRDQPDALARPRFTGSESD